MRTTLSTLTACALLLGTGAGLRAQCDTNGHEMARRYALTRDNSTYLRFVGENDFFKLREGTDRYFTNGERMDVFFASRYEPFLEKVFPTFCESPWRTNEYGASIGLNMYTPTDITQPIPDSTDRPYAGWAYLAVRSISTDLFHKRRLICDYSFGVIGPAAQQEAVQKWVHKAIDSPDPKGWDRQIRNDVAVNVGITYESELFHPVRQLQIIGSLEGSVGTVTNYLGIGGTFRFGTMNDHFVQEFGLRDVDSAYGATFDSLMIGSPHYVFQQNTRRRFQLFFFIKPYARAVLDNSLLEGGWSSWSNSPHIVPADRIERFVVGAEYGVQVVTGGIGIAYTQSFRSPEFEGARYSHWGGIALTVRLSKGREDPR